MSYLDVPRLHFFGSFFANPSTNNNNPDNYSLAALPEGPPDPPGFEAPLWNPDGSHTFMLGPPAPQGVELAPEAKRFFPCRVTGIATGSKDTDTDPILGATVRTPNYAVLVDLDTDQQWVSQIIGSALRIEQGADVIRAKLPMINFVDIFWRVSNEGLDDKGKTVYRGKDSKWSAAYQTVLTDVEWSDWPDSPFVQKLRDATVPGTLSIRFVVDGYHTKNTSSLFRYGRMAGTIGPWREGEPRTFVNARYLRPLDNPYGHPSKTHWGNFNYAPAKTDLDRRVITFDLGNAIPTTWPETGPDDSESPDGFPTAVHLDKAGAYVDSAEEPIHLGDFDLSQEAYETNSYVQEFPLDDAQLEALKYFRTRITVGLIREIVMSENLDCAYTNFDQYVFRLNEGGKAEVDLCANMHEIPAEDVEIKLELGFVGTMNDGQAPPGEEPRLPPNNEPPAAIEFPKSVTTDSQGRARFRITAAGNPAMNGAPREFIDGQVYGVVPKWAVDEDPNPNIGVSVKIFNTVAIPENPTWNEHVFPILNQFRWLYPVMVDVVKIDLSNYESVKRNIDAIRERIQLPFDNTGYMPITRELSGSKTKIILRWADNGCPK